MKLTTTTSSSTNGNHRSNNNSSSRAIHWECKRILSNYKIIKKILLTQTNQLVVISSESIISINPKFEINIITNIGVIILMIMIFINNLN